MANLGMLQQAANSGDINMLYDAIEHNPHVLEEMDAIPFVDTPLHSAAFVGHIEFCIEIMRLKPSFGLNLNKKGFSPVHIALLNNHYNLVRCLVEINEELVRVKGREGFTPFHFLCQSDSNENIRMLLEFLKICPDSIKDVNVRRESALHIAIRYGNLRALRVMFRWLEQNTLKDAKSLERSLPQKRDVAGNNILHLATLKGNTEAIDLLIKRMQKWINVRNMEGKTALDLAERFPEIKRTLLKVGAEEHSASVPAVNLEKELRSKRTFWGIITLIDRIKSSISMEERNLYMVISALIITAIYQSALSPPGGLYQADGGGGVANNNSNNVNATSSLNFNNTAIVDPGFAGISILPPSEFSTVAILNSCTLLFALSTVFLLLPRGLTTLLFSCPLFFFMSPFFSFTLRSPPKPILISTTAFLLAASNQQVGENSRVQSPQARHVRRGCTAPDLAASGGGSQWYRLRLHQHHQH
ncbi:hypothetical protein PIB30_051276 [Stylosanthes scabra]|uniref:PGG domain-containing protein n=1 Tax=Stylosanthes scabra TaxID=79078 RepID=A0ABU6TJY6_9FABA|nr:hypothetical protein [Stylosanthes scabra]